jgi:signal recognition particle receptor subunit beta
MSFINYAAREINVKIVFYGPGLCGKTTNLQYIYEKSSPQQKGKLISLATETDRTLFFDFLPLDLGAVRGFKTRFHLYTVPGQVFYDASRKLILKGVDGVVFVADSQEARMDANVESLRNLEENLNENGFELKTVPYVLQFNKRDLPSAMLVDDRGLRDAQGGGQAGPLRAPQSLSPAAPQSPTRAVIHPPVGSGRLRAKRRGYLEEA